MTRLAKTTRAGCSAVTAVAAAIDTAVATGSPTRRRASVACAPAGVDGMHRIARPAIATRAASVQLIPCGRVSPHDAHVRQAWSISPCVASGFSRKPLVVVNLWATARSLPPKGGSHTSRYGT